MKLEAFYQKLLNPPQPWHVERVKLADDGSRVDIWLEHERYTFLCSKCLKPASTYDHMPEREWQHLDTCESKELSQNKLSNFVFFRPPDVPTARYIPTGMRLAAAPSISS